MTSIKELTPEYLGQDATAGDLEDFIDQCERIMDEGFSEEEAIDIVWNDGSIDLKVAAIRFYALSFIRHYGTDVVIVHFAGLAPIILTPKDARMLRSFLG